MLIASTRELRHTRDDIYIRDPLLMVIDAIAHNNNNSLYIWSKEAALYISISINEINSRIDSTFLLCIFASHTFILYRYNTLNRRYTRV